MSVCIQVTGASHDEVAALLDSAVASGRHVAHRGPESIPGTNRWHLALWLNATDSTNSTTPNPDPGAVIVERRFPAGAVVRTLAGTLVMLAVTGAGYWLAGFTGVVVAAIGLAGLVGLLSIAIELHRDNTANLRAG